MHNLMSPRAGAPAAAKQTAGASSGASVEIDRADFQLLAEIGFSAIAQGHGEDAKPIFDALKVCKPDNAAWAIGYGLSALVRGDYAAAVEILERDGLKAKESVGEAKAVLLIALHLAGRESDAAHLRRELLRSGGVAKGLVQAMMR